MDQDVRRNIGWDRDVRAQFERVNDFVQPRFARSFEIAEILPWERKTGGTDLDEALEELESLDVGRDVDWVLGVITPLPLADTAVQQLGMSRRFGRHVLLRRMDDPEELSNIMQGLDGLSEEEQLRLYGSRRLHKEVAVLLFAWGYSLGAVVSHQPGSFMNRMYEGSTSHFSKADAEIIELGLEHRDQMSDGRAEAEVKEAWRAALERVVAATTWPGWEPESRVELLALLRGDPAAEVGTAKLRRRYGEAVRLLQKNEIEEAWTILSGLRAEKGNPLQALVVPTACHVSSLRGRTSAETLETCTSAADLAKDDPQPHLTLAHAYADLRDRSRAEHHLTEAEARLATRSTSDTESWRYLAGLHRQLWNVTRAERAAARAGDAGKEILEWVKESRPRLALPPNASTVGLAPEDEGTHLEAVFDADTKIDAGDLPSATALVAELLNAHPDAPSALTVRCRLNLRLRRFSLAEDDCRGALRRYPDALHAQLLTAILLEVAARNEESAKALSNLVSRHPAYEPSWRTLADYYRRHGPRAALEELRGNYEKRFGKKLD